MQAKCFNQGRKQKQLSMWHYIVVRKLYVVFQNEDVSRP